MVKIDVAHIDNDSNAQFVPVPFADILRLERGNGPIHSWIQLYPIIASFSKPHGCFLSFDKLAAYAGMRKKDIGPTIEQLVQCNWIEIKRQENKKIILCKKKYNREDSKVFYMLGTEILRSGIWAMMQRTKQVIYSILQAWSVCGTYIISELLYDRNYLDEVLEEERINGHKLSDCSFLSLKKYNIYNFITAAQASMKKCSYKQFQRAIQYFQDYELMIYTPDFEGYVFPRRPRLRNPEFEKRLQKIDDRLKEHRLSYSAKRAALASSKRISHK